MQILQQFSAFVVQCALGRNFVTVLISQATDSIAASQRHAGILTLANGCSDCCTVPITSYPSADSHEQCLLFQAEPQFSVLDVPAGLFPGPLLIS